MCSWVNETITVPLREGVPLSRRKQEPPGRRRRSMRLDRTAQKRSTARSGDRTSSKLFDIFWSELDIWT